MCINNPVQDIWIGESEIGLGWIWRVSFDTCFCVFFGTGVAGYCFGGGGGSWALGCVPCSFEVILSLKFSVLESS